MTDPRSLTTDQREFLDAFEQVALLRGDPDATLETLVERFRRVLDMIEERVQQTKGRGVLEEDLVGYEAGFRRDGHDVAADGAALMRWRLRGEIAHGSSRN